MILDNYKDKGRRNIRAQKPQKVPRSSKSCDGKQTELAVVLKITPINRETLTIVRVIIEFYSIIYLHNVFTFFPTSSSIILLSKARKIFKKYDFVVVQNGTASKSNFIQIRRVVHEFNQLRSRTDTKFTLRNSCKERTKESLLYLIAFCR